MEGGDKLRCLSQDEVLMLRTAGHFHAGDNLMQVPPGPCPAHPAYCPLHPAPGTLQFVAISPT